METNHPHPSDALRARENDDSTSLLSQHSRVPHQSGFTLIELLVVIGIIGVLASVAVPQYSAYKARAFDTRAQMDLRHVALAEEAYFLDAERYLSCVNQNCTKLPGIKTLSQGVTLSITATTTGFTGTSKHAQGSGKVYTWKSDSGGML